VRANVGYLDSEYDEFVFDSGFGLVDNSGFDFRRAPEFSGTVDATYEWQVGGGEAWVRGSYQIIDELFTEQTNRAELANDVQHMLNLSVNYKVNDVTFGLFGRNLLEEDAYAHGLNVAGLWSYAIPKAPRTWGVELSYNFGG
jgi:iron complex outermembrane receptor protein